MRDRIFRQRANIVITRSCMRWYVRKNALFKGQILDIFILCVRNNIQAHQIWISVVFTSHTFTALGKDKKDQPHFHCTVVAHPSVTSIKCNNDGTISHLSDFRISDSLLKFFHVVLNGEQEKIIHYLCKDGTGKSFPHGSSLGKPYSVNC